MAYKSKGTKESAFVSKKQLVIEGISSVCALFSSIAVIMMVFFKKWICVNLLQTETVTAFELPDIINSYRRMIEDFKLISPDDIENNFGKLDMMSNVFIVLCIVIAVLLIIHIAFLVFGKGKWVRTPVILAFVLFVVLIIGFNLFADKVNESVAEIDLGFFSVSNVLSYDRCMLYTMIPLGIGVVSSFIYSCYKKKN